MKDSICHGNLVLLIIVLVILSGCIENNNEEPKNAEIDVSYKIIFSNVSSDSIFLIPRIINLSTPPPNHDFWKITDVMDISNMRFTNGKGNIVDNTSFHGAAIKIICSEDSTLEYHQSISLKFDPPNYEDPHFILNLENTTSNWDDFDWNDETNYFVYYNGSSKFSTIKIEFTFSKDIGRSGFYTSISAEGNLKNGWNEIPGIRSTLFAD